jgi:hypothetical protein
MQFICLLIKFALQTAYNWATCNIFLHDILTCKVKAML